MNATNRVINRALLAVFGLILLIVGAAIIVTGGFPATGRPTWIGDSLALAQESGAAIADWTLDIPGVGVVPGVIPVLGLLALVLVVLLIVFVFTRGRGRTKNVLHLDTDAGRTTVDRNVVDAVITAPLLRRPDVVSARTGTYLVKRTRAVELTVTVQQGASLGAVVAAAEEAITDWDRLLGSRIPVMVHLSDRSWRDALRSRTRVR